MDSAPTITPAVIALLGAGAVLLYLGTRRGKAVANSGGQVRCDLLDPQSCAPTGKCIPVQGDASGFGVCYEPA